MKYPVRSKMEESRISKTIGLAVDGALTFLGAFMSILIFYNVLSRYVFNTDLAWSAELATILLVWATLLGGASGTRHGCHIAVNEFINLMPQKLRWFTEIYIYIASLIFVLFMTYYGYSLAKASMAIETMALGWPVGIGYAAVPIGGACMIVFLLEKIRVTIVSKKLPAECAESCHPVD